MATIPRVDGVSGSSTLRPGRPGSPSPAMTRRCRASKPMKLFTCVTRIRFSGPGPLARRAARPARGLVSGLSGVGAMVEALHFLPPDPRDTGGVLEEVERREGGLHDVVRVGRVERLGEDVLDA